MLYSQAFIMPASGVHRIGTIGGSALERVKQDNGSEIEMQVGYQLPTRFGLIRVRSVDGVDLNIFNCTISAFGINNNPVRNSKCPGDIVIELPASVVIEGPEGTNIIVEAWPAVAVNSCGASQSFVGNQAGIAIPPWACAIDFSGQTAIFRDTTAAIVGAIDNGAANATVTGFSIPKGAVTVDIAGLVAANTTLIFTQQ